MLTTLHVWERTEFDNDKNSITRRVANHGFCYIMIDALNNSVNIVSCTNDLYEDDKEYKDDDEIS